MHTRYVGLVKYGKFDLTSPFISGFSLQPDCLLQFRDFSALFLDDSGQFIDLLESFFQFSPQILVILHYITDLGG